MAGAVVAIVAIALAVFFLRDGDDRQAETAGAPESAAASSESGAAESSGEPEQAEAAGETSDAIQTVRATTSGAEVVESATEPSGTETAALPPQEAPGVVIPRFDVVRVEPSGEAVIAGIAAPNSTVILLDGDTPIAQVTADYAGSGMPIVKDVSVNVLPLLTPCGADRAPVASRAVLLTSEIAQCVAGSSAVTLPSVIAEIVTSRPPPPRSPGALIVGETLLPSVYVVVAPV